MPDGCCRARFPAGHIPGLVRHLAGFQCQHALQREESDDRSALSQDYFCIATFSCHWAPSEVATCFQSAPASRLRELVFKRVSITQTHNS